MSIETSELQELPLATIEKDIGICREEKADFEQNINVTLTTLAILTAFQQEQENIHPNVLTPWLQAYRTSTKCMQAKLGKLILELALLRAQLDTGLPIERCIDFSDLGLEKAINKLERLLGLFKEGVVEIDEVLEALEHERELRYRVQDSNKRVVEPDEAERNGLLEADERERSS